MSPENRWQNKVIRHEDVAPDQLLASPWNYRIHSHLQESALENVLNDIGWVRPILCNERTGHVIDGHLRVALAINRNEPTVPVDFIDVSEADEQALLSVLDPLTGMAGTDTTKLSELLAEVQETASDALKQTLSELKRVSFVARSDPFASDAPRVYTIIVECQTPDERTAIVQRLTRDGVKCRVK
jgi:hypothetical protein